MREPSVTSKTMPAHVVPRVVLFLHSRTPCSQHIQYSIDEDQLAVKMVHGRSHERGNCPAYGTKCFKCGGMNHFKEFCRTRHSSSSSKGPSPFRKGKPQQYRDRRSSGSFKGKSKGPSTKGGGGGSTPYKKKKQPFKNKNKVYSVTLKENPNSVLSAPPEASGPVQLSCKGKVKSENSVLSGPPKPGTFNAFACDAVHSKLSHTHNGSNAASKRLYTDTDPTSQTEIITNIQVKKPAKAGSLWMEVKVDPGSEANCMQVYTSLELYFPIFTGMVCQKKEY